MNRSVSGIGPIPECEGQLPDEPSTSFLRFPAPASTPASGARREFRSGVFIGLVALVAVAAGTMLDPRVLSLSVGELLIGQESAVAPSSYQPLLDALKLVAAACIGLFVTVVSRASRDRPLPRSMEQAQVLLCVAGAVVMILVGNSLARAFGIAGAASIVRFRTPIDDPRDATVLFLLMAFGMAAGLGALLFAALGAIALSALLIGLSRVHQAQPKTALLDLVASGPSFPGEAVRGVFERRGVAFEPRETVLGREVRVKYALTLPPDLSIDAVSTELLDVTCGGLASIVWETKKSS